ncbi:MAG: hypothetical protein KAR45_12435 [Desulfobacteraceae bacterium]|nr:hypothetical protein [Desulfobacteraceae bacterium]
MTHEDAGHYAKKHQDVEIDKDIEEKLKKDSEKGNISCPVVHSIAHTLSTTPDKIGIQADLLEMRILHCQIGLFGWDPLGKLIDKNVDISEALEQELKNTVDNNRITCLGCWDIAKKLKIKKLDVASACEKKGIKIKKCQIGAF